MGSYFGAYDVDEMTKEPYNIWVLTITLWPKQCSISGKQIPMYSKAYVRKDNFSETWALKEEFIFARLKGEI